MGDIRKFFMPPEGSTIVLLGESPLEARLRLHEHFLHKLDYKKTECRVHEVLCTGHVSRADCQWCAPTPIAKRLYRELETNVDRAFLARYAPELLR